MMSRHLEKVHLVRFVVRGNKGNVFAEKFSLIIVIIASLVSADMFN